MPKKIVLVGHCGPDAVYLMIAIRRAVAGADVLAVDDEEELARNLTAGVDLLLLNRELQWGFEESRGVDLIKRLRHSHPHVRLMLISNYPEAHAEAVDAGAMNGFGKRELGSKRVSELLRDALL